MMTKVLPSLNSLGMTATLLGAALWAPTSASASAAAQQVEGTETRIEVDELEEGSDEASER